MITSYRSLMFHFILLAMAHSLLITGQVARADGLWAQTLVGQQLKGARGKPPFLTDQGQSSKLDRSI